MTLKHRPFLTKELIYEALDKILDDPEIKIERAGNAKGYWFKSDDLYVSIKGAYHLASQIYEKTNHVSVIQGDVDHSKNVFLWLEEMSFTGPQNLTPYKGDPAPGDLKFGEKGSPSKNPKYNDFKYYRAMARPEQARFRRDVMAASGATCLISENGFAGGLEAAHIVPVSEKRNFLVSNGIMLRRDIHKLFDDGLIAIHPESSKAWVSPQCRKDYKDLHEKSVTLPSAVSLQNFEDRWAKRKS